jgi:hypothetical protein
MYLYIIFYISIFAILLQSVFAQPDSANLYQATLSLKNIIECFLRPSEENFSLQVIYI